MATFEEQIVALGVRMAQECNAIRSETGPRSDLQTTEKATIVGAINELVARLNNGEGGGGAVINDDVTAASSVWSSLKTSQEIALGATTVIQDTGSPATNKTWSSSKSSEEIDGRISTAIAGLPVAAVIDDTNTTVSTTWSSFKTNQQINTTLASGLANFLDDNDTATDSTWSSSKITQAIAAAIAGIPPASQIDDSATSTSKTWSSNKISTYVANAISGITKANIGLANVDNTSDANKPVSTAQQAAINGAVSGITKASIGLANVDNTADANKPVSTPQQTAITNAVAGVTKASLGLGNVDNTSDANKPVSTAQAAAIASAVSGITKASLGLGNVDNTSDANKPVSTAQAAADAVVLSSAKSYAESLVVGLWDDRGNYDASSNTFPTTGGSGSGGAVLKSDIWTISVAGTLGGTPVAPLQTLRAMVDAPGQTAANWAISIAGMANIEDQIVDGVTGKAPSQNAVYDALQLKQDKLSAGTNAQVRLGDNSVATANKSLVGLANVDNTSDANKPVSTAQATAISTAVAGVTKASLGLGNVDNTSDANKPVSTAQATAISTAIAGVTKTAIKDEGTQLTADVTEINFVGAGVSATNTGGAVTVTIAGSTGGAVIDDANASNTTTYSSNKINSAITAGVATVTKTSLGLANVENKSSATIRGELTAANVTSALTYTPGQAVTVKDEGTNLSTNMASINFVGPGVTATTTGDAITVTVPGGASSTDVVPEGSTNKYYTDARAIAAVLSGYVVAAANAAVAATDTVVVAFGKLQKQINDLATSVAAAVTLNGTQTLTNKTLTKPTLTNYVEDGVAEVAGGATLVPGSTYSQAEFSVSASATLQWPALQPGTTLAVKIRTVSGSPVISHSITGGSGTIKYAGKTAPIQSVNAGDECWYFGTVNRAGTAIYISMAGPY